MGAPNKPTPPAFDVEALAIFLACGADETKKRRPELLDAWDEKDDSVREAYRRRARRLMKVWRTP